MNQDFSMLAKRCLVFVLVLTLLLSFPPVVSQAAGTWTYRSGYSWISGSFQAEDADLVYEDGQDYDWAVTITPGKKPPTSAQVLAFITDESGATVSRYSATVNGLTQHEDSVLCSYVDFPELTNTLAGTFTLTVDLQLNGDSYATLVQTFRRTFSSPIVSTVTSRSKPNLVFTYVDPLDLVLTVKKTDGVAETFLAAVTVTDSDGSNVLAAKGIFLPSITYAVLSVKDLMPLIFIDSAGAYRVNVTLTNSLGTVLHRASTPFRVLPVTGDTSIESNISVGFGRVDISPQESVPLRGYGYSSGRMSTNIQDPLYATCIAITDSNGTTALLYTLDIINAFTDVMNAARQQISDTTGVPYDAILVACTHTHSGPDLDNLNEPSIPRYIESLKGWMTQAAVAALADRAPATVYTTSTETENLNFVRRYLLSDGSYAGDNFGSFSGKTIVGHETDADGQLQLASFRREGKKDIILANFQTHPHRSGGGSNTNVTADLIAPFRSKMESTLDCYFAYFTGASGNINPKSRIDSENITSNYIQQGEALADYALNAYASFQEIPADSVKITKTVYMGKVDHTYDKWGSICVELVDHFMKYGNYGNYTSQLTGSGIKNIYMANAVGLRSKMPEYQELSLYALTLGDLAFVTVPFELFDTNGMQIKEGSPFGTTFVLSCAINSFSYLPSDLAFRHGGYAVDVTLFVRGTAEELVSCHLDMLNTLYYGQ